MNEPKSIQKLREQQTDAFNRNAWDEVQRTAKKIRKEWDRLIELEKAKIKYIN